MTVFQLRKWLNKRVLEGEGNAEVYVWVEDTHGNFMSVCVNDECLFLFEAASAPMQKETLESWARRVNGVNK